MTETDLASLEARSDREYDEQLTAMLKYGLKLVNEKPDESYRVLSRLFEIGTDEVREGLLTRWEDGQIKMETPPQYWFWHIVNTLYEDPKEIKFASGLPNSSIINQIAEMISGDDIASLIIVQAPHGVHTLVEYAINQKEQSHLTRVASMHGDDIFGAMTKNNSFIITKEVGFSIHPEGPITVRKYAKSLKRYLTGK